MGKQKIISSALENSKIKCRPDTTSSHAKINN
jgi:hypothetical protein